VELIDVPAAQVPLLTPVTEQIVRATVDPETSPSFLAKLTQVTIDAELARVEAKKNRLLEKTVAADAQNPTIEPREGDEAGPSSGGLE
jgi:hypothetical protein